MHAARTPGTQLAARLLAVLADVRRGARLLSWPPATSRRRDDAGAGCGCINSPGSTALPPRSCVQYRRKSERRQPSAAGGLSVRRDYRLYVCARCRRLVAICSVCDRGQWYCGWVCSRSHAAGQRYQASRRGRHRDAARQARYWQRRRVAQQAAAQKVTHQATPDHLPTFTLQATTRVSSAR